MELTMATRNLRILTLAAGISFLLGLVCPQKMLEDSTKICLQPLVKGSCRAIISRWYYDRHSQTCKEFTYGGCEGNDNNFLSWQECSKRCSSIPKVPKTCRLEADVGICRGLNRRYFFNLKTMSCELFYYGGCNGNENRFDDEESCMDTCMPIKTGPSFCYSPKDKGLCSASVSRFYYNIKTKSCEEFSYTGCGGNDNNFTTEKLCLKVCKKAGRRKPRFMRKIKAST
ncbi:tissue factor pathway inhibitor 2 isoform X1 [Sceloporus undulatus]|uniref:tissue factor pathway inhibitor 2 isoform X1 n=1 Tax=Sceloporus undulatus TaxID=8520 RepID=UPI001C4CB64D|nr:tissue factor pathway inhibitor 2 isoform X1 [Sceloporus undulatus]